MTMQSRLSPIDPDHASPEQRAVLADILSGPRGNLDGPFLAWIHSPGLADPAQKLGAFCRYHTRLAPRLSELAILVTAAWWRSQAEWQIHQPIALAAGLDAEVAEAIRCGQEPAFARDDEALVYRFARALYAHRRVDDALYAEAVDAFDEPGVVELVGVLGYYALVAMTLNAFAMRRDSHEALPFAER